jgi:curved DNA-binding protein CbpA
VKNYFDILGLSADAGLDDVKQAYRALAKKFHPDKNKDPRAHERFIEINEAYEFLSDPTRLKLYKARRVFEAHKATHQRQQEAYEAWVRQQKDLARRRAEHSAHKSYQDFVNSPIYKTAMVVSNAYNYIFMAVGALIVLSPVYYLTDAGQEQYMNSESTFMPIFAPILLGSGFMIIVYRMVFKGKF